MLICLVFDVILCIQTNQIFCFLMKFNSVPDMTLNSSDLDWLVHCPFHRPANCYLLRFGGSKYGVTNLLQIIRQRAVAVVAKKLLHNYTADGATSGCLDLPSKWRLPS